MAKDKTRRIIVLGARIVSLRTEADLLENEIDRLIAAKEIPVEKAEVVGRRGGQDNGSKKRKLGTGYPLSDPELEAAVLRLLTQKGPTSITEMSGLVHANPKRVKKLLIRLAKSGQLQVQMVKVPAGNRMMSYQRYCFVNGHNKPVDVETL